MLWMLHKHRLHDIARVFFVGGAGQRLQRDTALHVFVLLRLGDLAYLEPVERQYVHEGAVACNDRCVAPPDTAASPREPFRRTLHELWRGHSSKLPIISLKCCF